MSKTERKYTISCKCGTCEVSQEVFEAYHNGKRKMKYFESDLKNGKIIIDYIRETVIITPSREDSYERLSENNIQFADDSESVEDQVIWKIASDYLWKCVAKLPQLESIIITEIYRFQKSERDIAVEYGIPKSTVHYKRKCAEEKLRNILTNG